ncbi:hypothetical protein BH09BAC1_BH09BAC1_03780 [soil metagenome]
MLEPKKQNKTPTVDELMAALEHPLKVEIEAVRAIILNANHKIAERVKWNSPSFHYNKLDLAAIHTRSHDCVHIIFVFYNGDMIESKGLLEGDYKDRRMAKFYSMEDIIDKKTALEKVVNEWVELIERNKE